MLEDFNGIEALFLAGAQYTGQNRVGFGTGRSVRLQPLVLRTTTAGRSSRSAALLVGATAS